MRSQLCAHMNLAETLEIIKPATLQAGELILGYLHGDKQISSKSAQIDLVTIADKKSEEYLTSFIKEKFPAEGLLAEEGNQYDSQSGYTWVVDPLDGTVNFAHGFPFFCVSVALVDDKNIPQLGLVYNPVHRELFTAIRGKGAWLHEQPIRVSEQNNMQLALVSTGFPYYRQKVVDALVDRLRKFLLQAGGIRRTGSAALDLCYVACGRFDAYYEEGLNPWDMGAGVLIIEEAGGKIAKFDGSTADIEVPELLASNHHLMHDLVRIFNE